MKLTRLLLLSGFAALLTACSESTPPTDPLYDDHLAMQQRIRIAIEKSYLEKLGVDEENARKIETFYKQRNYKPLWSNDSTLNEKGRHMSMVLEYPGCIGIPQNRWNTSVKKQPELISRELLITAQLGCALTDLSQGFIDTAHHTLKPLQWYGSTNWAQQTDTVTDWASWFAGFGPKQRAYRDLAKGLYHHAFGKQLSGQTFRIPSIKKDSATCYNEGRKSLIDKGYLAENAPDSVFLAALEQFQTDNGLKPDHVIGNYTRQALEESAQHKVDRAILSLERWRWRERFPDRYIWINIPEYMLRLYYNDTLMSEHRVVVGKDDTRTPQLESSIRQIVAYPYWNVPYSISSKEILPALKRNPGYLARNHYKLFKGGEEIDPYSVDWKTISEKSFPYRVRQEPGTFNSLGVIKFEFSNPYGVYVHDTPSKSLFGTDVRSYSHGCIRCSLPDSLARFILRRDQQRVLPDSLDSMLARKQHRVISLRHPVAIKVDYITVSADSASNKLTFHTDIYRRDEYYLAWFPKEQKKEKE